MEPLIESELPHETMRTPAGFRAAVCQGFAQSLQEPVEA